MVAIVGGEGLGLFNTSLNQLNGFGGSGSHRIGNGNDRAYVNAVTGNLVIQSQDDYLAALGLDVSLMRTYNSRGLLNNVNDDNQDLWQLSFYRRLSNLPATGVFTPITREGGDGHQAVFTYDTTKAYWIATDGSGAHDTLKHVGSEWIYEDTTNGVTEIYDAAGKLSKLRNRDGQLITLGYTGTLVTSLVDGSGQTTTLTYTGHNLTQITTTPSGGSAATRVRYAYDGSNRLTQVKVDLLNPNDTTADAAANTYVTTYEYSGTSKRISRITQSDGSELKIGYILVGTEYQIASLQQLHGYNGSTPLYRTTTFNYDTANRRTDVYDNLGAVTSYYYDTANRLTKVVSPQVENGLLSSVSYSYDAKDNITQVATLIGSGESRTVSYAYDANGNPTEIRDQLGNTVRRTYNSADQLASEAVYLTPDSDGAGTGQPSNGLTTWYVYDAEQHLRYVISPEGRVTHNGYITNGLLATARVWTQEFYRPANPTDALEYTEDKLTAWATALVDKSKAERTDYTYNALGQLLTSTQHAALTTSGAGTGPASVTSYVYSRSGELLSKIDPNPTGTGTATTTYSYDGLGRLLTTQDASGRTSTTLYNDASSTVVVTSDQVSGGAYRLQTTSVYNKAGERISQTQVGGSGTPLGTTLNFYDANGRMRMAQDPTGARVHYVYDARGRQVGQINAEGELTETVYNGAGQVIRTIRYDGRVDVSTLVDGTGKPLPKTIEQIRGVAASPTSRPVTDLNGAAAGIDHAVTAVGATYLVPSLNLSEDSGSISGATVTIINIKDVGSESLKVNELLALNYGISVSKAYNGSIGTLTLSGSATVARYQEVLRTLQYENVAHLRNLSVVRTVNISVTDGQLGSKVTLASVTVGNHRPVVDLNGEGAGNGHAISYTENDPATLIVDGSNLSITDGDDSLLEGATARILNPQVGGVETLSVTAGFGITANFNAVTGVLTLSGTSSVSNYQTVLRSLRYANASDAPETSRSVEIQVNDGLSDSVVAVSQISITPVNDAPVVDFNSQSPGIDHVIVMPDVGNNLVIGGLVDITDPDGTIIVSARAEIIGVVFTAERLTIETAHGISADYWNGVMTLTGTGTTTISQFREVLSTLNYQRTLLGTIMLTDRVVEVTVNDGQANSLVSSITVLRRGSTLPAGMAAGSMSAAPASSTPEDSISSSVTSPEELSEETVTSNEDAQTAGVMSLMAVTAPTIGAATNRITDYIYDAAGRLAYTLSDDAEDVSGVETTKRTVVEMGYDGASRLIREVSYAKRLDTSVALTESAIKSVLAQSTYKNDAANRATRYFYTSDGQRQGTLDAEGYLTEQKYDAAGRLQEQVRYATPTATSPTTLRTTGTLDQLRPALDATNDQATRQLYDARGQLVGSIDAMGYLTRYTYNTAGSLTEERRYAQAVVYDGLKILTDYVAEATPASGLKAWIKAYAYDSLNRLVTLNESTLTNTTGSLLTRTTYEYNAVTGFLDRTTKAAELATTYSERRSTTFEYDALGRVLKEVDGEGSEVIRAATGDAAAIAATVAGAYAAYGSQHEYDLAGRRIKTTEASGKVNLYFYDRDGRLRYTVSTGSTAGQGEVAETLYNAFGEAEAITQYAAPISLSGLTGGTNFATVASRVASIVNSTKDRTTTLDYTLRGQLKQKTDAESHITRQIYNAFGQLASRTTAVQLSSVSATVDRLDTWTYDRKGLLKTSVLNSGGGDQAIGQTLSYDAFGRITEKKDGMNRVWKTGYDQLGRQVTTTDPLNNSTAPTTYDAFSRVLTQTDKLGQTTSYSYNTAAAGRSAVTVTTPEGVVTTTTYDRHGSQVKIELQNNGITEISTWWYDRNGRLTSQIIDTGSGRLNLTTASEYSKSGLLIGSIDANGIRTSYAYDAANRVMTRTVDPSSYPLPNGTTGTKTGALNLSTQYAYDAFGSVIKTTDAELVVTETIFDRKGQTVAVVVDTAQRANKPAPLLLATVYSYDTEGRTLELKEGVQATRVGGALTYSGAATRTTQYGYDKAGRRTQEIVDPAALAITTSYAYDKNDNLIRKTDANGNHWRYVFDELNRQVFSIDPLKGLTEKSYDKLGRVTRIVQYTTLLATLPNDAAGIAGTAVTSVRAAVAATGFAIPGGDRVTWYAYDNDGRQVYQVDALGHVTESRYDKAGRVLETIQYSQAIDTSSLPANPTLQQIALQLPSTTAWKQDFSSNADGLVLPTQSGYMAVESGRLKVTAQANAGGTIHPIARGQRLYSASAYPLIFGSEVDTGPTATGRSFSIGAENSTAPSTSGYRRVQVTFTGTTLSVTSYSGSVATTQVLGSIASNTTYVVKVSVTSSGTEISVYRKGHPPESGWTHAFASTWNDARTFMHTTGSPSASGASVYVDNLSETIDYGRSTKHVYDAAGRRIYDVDALNTVTQNFYDGNGNLTRQREYDTRLAAGTAVTKANLDSASLLPRVDTKDRLASYAYDAANRLRFSLRFLNHSTSTASFNAYVTENRYDRVGQISEAHRFAKLIALSSPVQTSESLTVLMASAANQSPDDQHDYRKYDGAGNLIEITDAEGGVQKYTYDLLGNKKTYVNQNVRTWTYSYDAAGRLSYETSPQVEIAEITGAGSNQVVKTTAGIVTHLVYDGVGNVKHRVENYSTTSPANSRVTTYDYDAVGRQTQTRNANVVTIGSTQFGRYAAGATSALSTLVTYDVFGNAVVSRDAGARFSYKTYDVAGRVRYEIDADNYATQYSYDRFGNITVLKRYANALSGHTAGAVYTEAEVLSRISASDADRSVITSYNALDQKESVVEPIAYHYDSTSGASSAESPVSYFEYNAFGEEILNSKRVRTGVIASTYFYYDQLGNQIAQVDPMGYLTQRVYSATGAVLEIKEWSAALAAGTWSATSYAVPTPVSAQAPNNQVVPLWTSSFDVNSTAGLSIPAGLGTNFTATGQKLSIKNATGGSAMVSAQGDRVYTGSDSDRNVIAYDFSLSSGTIRGDRYIGIGNWNGTTQSSTTFGYYLRIRSGDVVLCQINGTRITVTSQLSLSRDTDYRVEFVTDARGVNAYLYPANSARGAGVSFRFDSTNVPSFRAQMFAKQVSSSTSEAILRISSISEKRGNEITTSEDALEGRQTSNVRHKKFEYDRLNRQIHAVSLGVITASVATDGKVNSSVDNQETYTSYDGVGNVSSFIDAGEGLTSMFYDALGRQVAVVGPEKETLLPNGTMADRSSLTRYSYDGRGNQVLEVKYAYGANGSQPEQANTALDAATYTAHDILGRVINQVDAEGQSTSYGYDSYGNVSRMERVYSNVDGSTGRQLETYSYNGRGLQTESAKRLTSGSTATFKTAYNAFGEVIGKGLQGGDEAYLRGDNQEVYRYDNAGRLILSNKDGIDTVYLYDIQGRNTAQITSSDLDLSAYLSGNSPETVANLAAGVRRKETVYDALGRAVQQTEASFSQSTAVSRYKLRVFPSSGSTPARIIFDFDTPGGGSPSIRVAPLGTSSWTNLAISRTYDGTNEWTANIPTSLAVGTYKYEIVTTVPGQAMPIGTQSGELLLQVSGMAGYSANPTGVTMSSEVIGGVPYYVFTPATGVSLSGMTGVELKVYNGSYVKYSVRDLGGGRYGMPVVRSSSAESWGVTSFRPLGVLPSRSIQYRAPNNTNGTGFTPAYTLKGSTQSLLTALSNGAIPLTAIVNLDLRFASFERKVIDSGPNQSWTSVTLPEDPHYSRFDMFEDAFEFRVRMTNAAGGAVNLSTILVNGQPLGTADGYISGVYRNLYGGQYSQVSLDLAPTNQQTVQITPTSYQSYDRWGNVLNHTDASGVLTNYRYDEFDRLIEVKKAATTAYTNRGTAYTVTPTYQTAYDAAGRVIAAVDANGNLSTQQFDVAGNLVSETDGNGAVTAHAYDAFNQTVQKTDAYLRQTRYAYDRMGRLTTEFNPAHTAADLFYYDGLGRRTGDSGGQVSYVYDADGRIIKEIRPSTTGGADRVTTTRYDSLGRVIERLDAQSAVERWTYDYFGRLQTHIALALPSTNTHTRSYSYNLAGDLTEEVLSTAGRQHAKRYSYYENGLLRSTFDPGLDERQITGSTISESLTEYYYDNSGRLKQERHSALYPHIVFPGDLDREWMTLRNGIYSYDSNGRLSKFSDGTGMQVSYFYDAQGNRKLITGGYENSLANESAPPLRNTIYRYQYDATNRVTGETTMEYETRSGTTYLYKASSTALEVDLVGNRLRASNYQASYNNAGLAAGTTLYDVMDAQQAHSLSKGSNTYFYDAANRLRITSNFKADGDADGGTTREYNDLDQVTLYTDSKATRTYQYNADGSTYRLDTNLVSGTDTYSVYGYDPAGHLTSQVVKRLSNNNTEATYGYNYVTGAGGYQQETLTATSSSGTNTTTNYYNFRGQLARARYTGQVETTQIYYDHQGKILIKGNGTNAWNESQLLYYFEGQQIGSYHKLIDNESNITLTADFGYNYDPISDAYPALTPSQYVVNSGDTLESIALAVYGDASFWYLIADANSIGSNSTLTTGLVLTIPNSVVSAKSNEQTFRPYNPAEIVGDLTPELPVPPRKCNTFASILIVVVAVVATVYTAGVAAGAGFGLNAFTAGSAVLTGSAAAGGLGAASVLGPTLGGIAAAGVGGAVGSAAGQLAGKGLGVVDHFSWKDVALGGLTAAVTAGIGAGLDKLGKSVSMFARVEGQAAGWQRNVLQGALNSAGGQGINKAFGRQDSFSWNMMAAAAITNGLSGGTRTGNSALDRFNALGRGDILMDTLRSTAYGVVNRSVVIALEGGGKIDLRTIAADSFGNALGNFIVRALQPRSPETEEPKSQRRASNSAGGGAEPEGHFSDQAFNDWWKENDPLGVRQMNAELDAMMAGVQTTMDEVRAAGDVARQKLAASGERPSSARVKADVAVTEAQAINLNNQRGSKITGDLVTIPDEWQQRFASQSPAVGSSPTLWDVVGSQSITSDYLRYFGASGDNYLSTGLHWLGEQVLNVPKAIASAPEFLRGVAKELPGALPQAASILGDIFFGDGIENAVDSTRQRVELGAQRREQMRADGDFYGLFSEYANSALALGTTGWAVGGRLNGLSRMEQMAAGGGASYVWHATPTPGGALNILDKGIDPAFMNANSRFGRGFYVAELPETTLAELTHHGVLPSTGIRFSVNPDAVRVLDLTNAKIAKAWGYSGGAISPNTRAIGARAAQGGYNAIRYSSERAAGTNMVVIRDFNEVLRPVMVSPTAP